MINVKEMLHSKRVLALVNSEFSAELLAVKFLWGKIGVM
jgi:hypothetical protein